MLALFAADHIEIHEVVFKNKEKVSPMLAMILEISTEYTYLFYCNYSMQFR